MERFTTAEYKTKYYGIYLVAGYWNYWLVTDNGHEQQFDHCPDEVEIDIFRDLVAN